MGYPCPACLREHLPQNLTGYQLITLRRHTPTEYPLIPIPPTGTPYLTTPQMIMIMYVCGYMRICMTMVYMSGMCMYHDHVMVGQVLLTDHSVPTD